MTKDTTSFSTSVLVLTTNAGTRIGDGANSAQGGVHQRICMSTQRTAAHGIVPAEIQENGEFMRENATLPVQANSLVSLGTLQASSADGLVAGATAIANTLALLIRRQKLITNIQGKEYVRCEGWTVLGALLGVIAREESVVERDDGSYLATVALVRMVDNVVVSRASAECGMDEPRWANGPKYARRSMALTRATGKAARLAFSWIMTLAGFEPTPAEEMPRPLANDDGTPDSDEFVPSGKHKGKKWEEVSHDYLQWAVKSDKAPKHLKAGCQGEIDRRAKVFQEGISEGEIPFEPTEGSFVEGKGPA